MPRRKMNKNSLRTVDPRTAPESDRQTRADLLKKRYGITLDQYTGIFNAQESVCAICYKKETRINSKTGGHSYLAVDHCSKTGKIRGLLCFKCNITLGMLNESIKLIDESIIYLEKLNIASEWRLLAVADNKRRVESFLCLDKNFYSVKLDKEAHASFRREPSAYNRETFNVKVPAALLNQYPGKRGLKKTYGLTLDEYAAIMQQQKNSCAICRRSEELFRYRIKIPCRLGVDHCHRTGRIRGLLCTRCNSILSGARDSVELLVAMKSYLLKSEKEARWALVKFIGRKNTSTSLICEDVEFYKMKVT